MNYKKEYKYLHDTKPSVIVLQNIKDHVYWKDLSWYSKQKMINEYCTTNNLTCVKDLRAVYFTDIYYDFHLKKVVNVNINIKEKIKSNK